MPAAPTPWGALQATLAARCTAAPSTGMLVRNRGAEQNPPSRNQIRTCLTMLQRLSAGGTHRFEGGQNVARWVGWEVLGIALLHSIIVIPGGRCLDQLVRPTRGSAHLYAFSGPTL